MVIRRVRIDTAQPVGAHLAGVLPAVPWPDTLDLELPVLGMGGWHGVVHTGIALLCSSALHCTPAHLCSCAVVG